MAAVVKRALLIGPSYAPDLPTFCQPLEGVQNDLHLMRDMLSRNGFHPENIMVLEGDMASRNNILLTLDKLSSIAEERSVVVIYFSGHGYELEAEITDDNIIHFDQGLLPAGLTREMVDRYHIYDTCITGEHFKPHLLKLIKKDCLVNTIFDCCFSGRMYRGFLEKDGAALAVKQLSFSKEYMEKYREILKARSPIKPTEIQPMEHDDEPMEYEPYQETQPPSPMHQYSRLQYPVQTFWTPVLSSQGWTPSDHDKFISIAASSSIEKAYEGKHLVTGVECGCLTSALVEVINEAQTEGKKISYKILKSLIKRKFAERKWLDQTPQFECGDINLALFDFDTVIQPKVIEICEVKVEHGFVKVVLNAGKLHGVIDGEYNIYTPDVADDELAQEVIDRYSINCINVNREDIGMLQSRGATLYQRDGTGITVGCKAVLTLPHSMCTPVTIKFPDFPLEKEHEDRMYLAIENQNMFDLEKEQKSDTVTLDIQIVEEKKCWRACQYGRMIVPYQKAGDESLMTKNMAKYFRHKFAIAPKLSNRNMLENVSFKLFKVENVPSLRNAPDKKTELIAKATKTQDLYGEFKLNQVPPTFRAHKVQPVKTMLERTRYKVVDGTGDAVVIQVTNNETRPIHVCVVSYQADGSIVILHPPKKGHTEVLRPGESTQTIKRVLLEPDTVRRMVEPDFDKPRPDSCYDVLILYATTEQTDYEPLTQTAIELSPYLSTRGPNVPDGLRLAFTRQFRNALRPPRAENQSAREGHPKWLTIRRDIRILYNEDPEPSQNPQ